MCLLLYASIAGSPSREPVTIPSPYLSMSPVNHVGDGDQFGILQLFPNRTVWLLVSDEGCACNMMWVGKADEDMTDWPQEIAAEARKYHERSLMRMVALRDFCREIASISQGQEMQIFAHWIGDPLEITETKVDGLEAFFGRDEVHFEVGHLYVLALPKWV